MALALAACSSGDEVDGEGSAGSTGAGADGGATGSGQATEGGSGAATTLAPTTTAPPATRLQAVADPALVLGGTDAATVALATTQALYAEAPLVAVAAADDYDAQARAASVAVPLGVPMLLAPSVVTVPAAAPSTVAAGSPSATTAAAATATTTAATGTPAPSASAAPAGAGLAPPATGAPVDLAAELERLGTRTVVTFGSVPEAAVGFDVDVVVAPSDPARLGALAGAAPLTPTTITGDQLATSVAALAPGPAGALLTLAPAATADDPASGDPLPSVARAAAPAGMVALADRTDPTATAAIASARAAGVPVIAVDGGDPRASADSRAQLQALKPTQVVALGTTGRFATAPQLAGMVRTAGSGLELPGGGQVLFPGRRLVALYGHPGDDNLGVLGEQGVEATVARAREVAATYQGVSPEPVVPTFEIITTVASASAGSDGDYSLESTLDLIEPWVRAAEAAGIYVVLDLQPGFTDFLTQAKRYESLLLRPNVGLALDPEWRLAPGQKHMVNIGSVTGAEVNATVEWLAELTRANGLPQKLLIVHQFRLDMITARDSITVPPEVAVMFQMDGLGPQNTKLDTWRAVTAGGPAGAWFGWKNFYDEDSPTRSPADTVAVTPSPLFISYQ